MHLNELRGTRDSVLVYSSTKWKKPTKERSKLPINMDGSAALVPSQALSSTGGTNPSNRNNRNRNRNRRRRQKQQQQQQQETAEAPKSDDKTTESVPRANRRNRNRRKKGNQVGNSQPDAVDNSNSKEGEKNGQPPKTARKRRQANTRRKRFPWRRHIPPGTVDPITLDPLVALPYPPFALVATEPYEPVPEWPIPENNQETNANETEQDRAKRILQEQWGDRAVTKQEEEEAGDKEPSNRRHYHLYDGRALAYYVVSQLQFIDPLNRRDLTRAELVHLDNYLERHGFARGNVVQAYDAKGVTLSTAGAAGNTAAGRAEILRQEAQGLLNTLFGGGSVHPAPTTTTPSSSSSLQQLYAASNQREQQQRNRAPHSFAEQNNDEGIYGDDGGMVIIDDDMNPGLRGGGFRNSNDVDNTAALDASALSFTPGTLWSASHITSQYSQAASVRAQNFPALPSASPAPAPAQHSEAAATTLSDLNKQSKKGPSRSLQRITKVVAKTDPKAVQRQREAREMFVRRAMMSNLAFGEEALPVADNLPPGLPSTITAAPHSDDGPTEGQVLRNQALASALGVAPSTVRASYNSGWARPTTTEFGNELNVSLYPDSLILQARERLTMVLKLEKKWKTFLADDTAASLPLNHMDRPLRTFVHEYSDYWRLHTESFDPEPKRYIHCVKLRDTRLPYPLLSEAARNWRGPSLPQQQQQQSVVTSSSDTLKQAAGQTPREEELPASHRREMPPPPERQPLPLKPRSLPVPPPGAMFDLADVSEALPKPDTETEAQINSRSGPLFTGRERPKLALAPRTRPLELPPFEASNATQTYNMAQERQRQELARQEKQRQQEEEQDKKRRILEAAFASSDEESLASYDSDDWGDEELEPEYASDEDEDLQE